MNREIRHFAITLFFFLLITPGSFLSGQVVTYPSDAGIYWKMGETHDIYWSGFYTFPVNTVKIELYYQGSLYYEISSSTANDGSFSWYVPTTFPAGTQYAIRISGLNFAAPVSDVSDNNFTMAYPELSYPDNSGINWYGGRTYKIVWSKFAGSNVKIELLKSQNLYSVISHSATNSGEYNWTVPAYIPSGSDYRIKVTSSVFSTAIYDISANYFSILQPTVLSPTASGITFYGGVEYDILWNNFDTESVRIDLYKGTTLYTTIDSNTPNDGMYSWTVPKSLNGGSDYQIKIISSPDGIISDISNEFFGISQPRVSFPNSSGDIFNIGSRYNILWNGFFGSTVKIDLYKGSTLISTINNSAANVNIYEWLVPESLVVSSDYFIKITSTANWNIWDISDYPFQIAPALPKLGNTSVYSSVTTQNNLRAIRVTFTEAALIKSVSIYHNGGSGQVQCGVYSDNSGSPSTALRTTLSTPVNAAEGWQTIQLTSSLQVSSGQTVWLAWVFESNPGMRYTTGKPARAQSTSTWTGNMPSTFGTSSFADYKYSVYCTYDYPPYLNVSPEIVTFSSTSGSTGSFTLSTNSLTWGLTASGTSWINIVSQEKITGTDKIIFNLATNSENTGTSSRSGNFKFSVTGLPDKYVTFYQEGQGEVKNIGNTTVYSSTSTQNYRRAIPVTFTEGGAIRSLAIYHNGGTGSMLMGVYSDASAAPASRLGATPVTNVISIPGWQRLALQSPVYVSKGQTIWLSWVLQNSVGVRYSTGTPARAQSAEGWAGGMPADFGAAAFANYKYSAFCTYIPLKPYLRVGTTEIHIGGDAVFSQGFTIESNVDWNITYIGDFFTVTPVSGTGNGLATAQGSNNPTAKSRTGTITVAGEGVPSVTITITQDGATKPLGNTEIYTSVSTQNYRRAIPVTFSETGTIQSLSIYHNGGTGSILMGVYSNSSTAPATKLGGTSVTTVNGSPGWQRISLQSPLTVSSGQTVWISWVFQNAIGVRYTTGTPARAQSTDSWSGGMPETFGAAAFANYKYSVYCNYTPEGTSTSNLGNTSVYSSVSAQNYRRAIPVTFTEAGTIQSLSIYHNGGTGSILMGVYSNSSTAPATRLGVTASTAVNGTAGWQTVTLLSPVSVTSGQTVWLSWVFQYTVGIRYTTGAPARAQSTASWSGGMPTTFGAASFADYKYSVYCIYTPGSTSTLGNTTVYSSVSTQNYRRAIPVTFTEPGIIQSISIYHNGGTGRILLGVYDYFPGSPSAPATIITRLGVTSETIINPMAGWQTVPLISPVTIIPGITSLDENQHTVWLAWVFETTVGVRYTTGTPARAQSTAKWSGGMPTTFGSASYADYKYSVYCTYGPVPEPGSNPEEESDRIKSTGSQTGINTEYIDKEEVLIYPNPTDGELIINWKNRYSRKLNITIYDILGRAVKEVQADPDINEIILDLTGNRDGIYLFEMKDKKNDMILNRSRIIKRK